MSEPLPDYVEWQDNPPSKVTPLSAANLRQDQDATKARIDRKLDAGTPPHLGPLRKWYAALSGAASAPAQIVVFGDSISEGAGATDVRHRWVTRLQAALRSDLAATGAEFPFIPAYPATGANWPVVRSGTVASYANVGLGWRTAILQDAAASLTFTFTGTRAKIMYFKASATGVMNIVVDGGTPVAINTNSATGGGTSNAAIWDTGALAAGAHTVVITRDATSVTGQHPYVQGLLTYNGDDAAGVRVIDASHSGYASTVLTTGATGRIATASQALAAAGGAQLAVIAFGTNDTIGPTPPAAFRTNLENLISGLRSTAGFSGSVLLLNVYKGSGLNDAVYSAFGQQMAAIAAADPDVAYLNLRDYMPDTPTPYADPSGLGLFADSLHPSSLGHGWIAQIIQGRVSLASAALTAG